MKSLRLLAASESLALLTEAETQTGHHGQANSQQLFNWNDEEKIHPPTSTGVSSRAPVPAPSAYRVYIESLSNLCVLPPGPRRARWRD